MVVRTRLQNRMRDETKRKRKRNGGNNGNNDKSGDNSSSGNDDNGFGEVEFREFLASVFPSKFANKKVEEAKRKQRKLKNQKKQIESKRTEVVEKDQNDSSSESESESDSTSSKVKTSTKNNGNTAFAIVTLPSVSRKHRKHKQNVKSNVKSNHNDVEDSGYESTDSHATEDLEDEGDTLSELFGDETRSEVSSDESYEPTDESDESDDSDDMNSENDIDIDDIDVHATTEDNIVQYNSKGDKRTTKNANKSPKRVSESTETNLEDIEHTINDKFAKLPSPLQNNCFRFWKEFKSKVAQEQKIHSKQNTKKIRKTNLCEFRKMLREGDVMNDLKYFNRFMNLDEQQRILADMAEVQKHTKCDKPYRLRLLESPIPPNIKAIAFKKINALRHATRGDSEYNKLKKWVDAFLNIPFGKYSTLDINLSCGQERCHEFMSNAKKTLDDAVYGLDDAKLQVMQMLGQWISNQSAIGSAIAIHGPMGTGKTTLVKDGISKILGREFIFIALGGASDGSFLEGHSYTYEASTWGKIVDLLMQCKTMNPVIYFDELDKVSDSPRGEEIIGILTHLTDSSQNDSFHDKYFSEINFDLSKCLFIFSYNDPERVNPILRDRMYTIKTQGYTQQQKITIANQYLIPKILPQIGFTNEEVIMPNETLEHICSNLTNEDEKGVRSLKRTLEVIYTKLNLYRLLKPGTEMFGHKVPDVVSFPITISKQLVNELIKKNTESLPYLTTMYT